VKVWIVEYGFDYEGYDIGGVFETQEGAYAEQVRIQQDGTYDNVRVTDHLVTPAAKAQQETQGLGQAEAAGEQGSRPEARRKSEVERSEPARSSGAHGRFERRGLQARHPGLGRGRETV
jgi:hypothetical protein